jgi:hypothetical protein
MFNLADYETVESRLEKWWKDYPDGRISTKLEQATDTRYIVSAELFKTEADTKAYASGLASESVSDRGVNSTSALENAETSAIGRALANAGYAAKGKRASREEMTKVVKLAAVPDPTATYSVDNKLDDPATWPTSDWADAIVAPKKPADCCDAGMTLRKGISKTTKKPYMGWVCLGQNKEHAIWAKISATGAWYFPDDAEQGKGGE